MNLTVAEAKESRLSLIKRYLRQPLLHFLIAGFALFVLYGGLHPLNRQSRPSTHRNYPGDCSADRDLVAGAMATTGIGQPFEIVYGTDGQRLVTSVDDRSPAQGEYLNMLHGGQFGVPAKYEIKDGHLLTTLGGTPFEATVFEQNGKYVAARSNEFGYVNYEVEEVK